MNPELLRRINAQDTWTLRECIGLASEFGIKTRQVILLVLGQGKDYIDREPSEGDASVQPDAP